MLDVLHHPVAGDQLTGFPPSAGSPDQMVGGTGKLRSAVSRRPGNREAEELIGDAVVEPIDHFAGHDGIALGIV